MIIELGHERHTVAEADVLTDLRVVTALSAADLDGAARAAGLGRTDDAGEHLHLDLARLRALARPEATRPDWDDQFETMIAYADSKGWLTDDGNAVRAHVSR